MSTRHGASATMRIARRCLVSGRVQGVYYRASARARALDAGIVGHARNLPDGRVEVFAVGEAAAMEQFIAWLWVGSTASRVSEVVVEAVELESGSVPTEFRTG